MQIPDKKIFDNYNIEIVNITPFRDGYIVYSKEDKYYFKRVDFNLNRLLYIHKAKEHLANNGFSKIDRNIITDNGNPYIFFNDCIFILTKLIQGKECNLLQRGDVQKASRSLAELHKASKGFNESNIPEAKSELYKFPMYLTKRLEEIKKLKKLAKKDNREFDHIFLKYSDIFIDAGEKAIKYLEGSEYINLCKKAETEGSLCHHDFTHSNILISDNDVNIINFDYICPELKIYDLANLLRRKLRKCNWDFDEGNFIIQEYMSVEDLSVEELRVMGIMLMFPQKLWRVSNKFYNSRKSFSEKGYVIQLKEVIEEINPSKLFLEKYEREYLKNKL